MTHLKKVVTQCSGCDNPIRDGDRFVRTNYGDFCSECFSIETAEYRDDASLDDFFGDIFSKLNDITIYSH